MGFSPPHTVSRLRAWIGLLLLCLSWHAQPALPNPFPHIASAYLVEVNGTPLWAKDPQRALHPASLTKLMTALLVLEDDDLGAVVPISRQAARITGSRLELQAGERFHAHDLLAATLIASANDACFSLAEYSAGNARAFVRRMNQRAGAIGLQHTHFVNPCGHDAPNHFSSADDLAHLARFVLRHPLAVTLAMQQNVLLRPVNGLRSYQKNSTNALLGRVPGVLGLKTGRTVHAGNCLIAVAHRGDVQVLLVLLKAKDRWWDAADLIELAFAHARHPIAP